MAKQKSGLPRNFGKIHLKRIEMPPLMMFKAHEDDPDIILAPGRIVGQPVDENEVPWKDVSKDEIGRDRWFIAVDSENGWIFCAEQDPTMLGIEGVEFWVIEHPGPDTDIRAHKWTGSEVVDFPPDPHE